MAEFFTAGDAVVHIAMQQPMRVTHVAESLAGQHAVTTRYRDMFGREFVYGVFKPEDLRKMLAEDFAPAPEELE